jgi:dihydroorotate dehydrogenase (fumarate)
MANLKTNYLGMELKNPVIMGACNLTLDVDVARRIEDAGAAAIVFKSLFEEQINLESIQMEEDLTEYAERNAEMINLFPHLKHAGPVEHLEKLSRLKKTLDIPVIGSLNCVYSDTWVEYAIEMEKTGIDALELNFYSTPAEFDNSSLNIETEQLSIIKEVRKKVKLPLSVKISPFYSNPLHLIRQMDEAGIDGFVLFNRLFQPDIDIESRDHYFPFNLSQVGDYRLPLRFAGLLYNQITASICSNTGIFSGQDVVRMILAGADCVQIVSTVYKNKVGYIATMLNDMESWMDNNSFNSLDEFRGLLSKANSKDPYAYQRAQYVDLLMRPFELMRKFPQV